MSEITGKYSSQEVAPRHTHIHLSIGDYAVILEDMALILGLKTNGLPVRKVTMSSHEALEAECLHHFGVAPKKSDCRGSCIKLTWLRDLKECLQCIDEDNIQRYVKCHIMLLFGMILFGDKFGAVVHWKFLPLLRDFGRSDSGITETMEVDAIDILVLLTLESHLMIFRKFVWEAYAVDRIEPDIIPVEIYIDSVVWSATVPLVSFECIEWHATDRFRRQFSFIQGVPHQEWSLDKAYGKVLTGPKNLD
ncbi:uncharacterized protein DS421_12g369260 [Arachis hypogaea]|nr:uncharacterized protein DS421_12g369260 [Arachis hypogaea]